MVIVSLAAAVVGGATENRPGQSEPSLVSEPSVCSTLRFKEHPITDHAPASNEKAASSNANLTEGIVSSAPLSPLLVGRFT